MTQPNTFSQRIGRSPAGVTWVAYKPEHVEPMRKRLAQLHERAEARRQASQSQRPSEGPTVWEDPEAVLEALDQLRSYCAGRRSQNLWVETRDGVRVCTYRSRYEDSAKAVRALVREAGGDLLSYKKLGTIGRDLDRKPWTVRFILGSVETAYIAREIGKRELRAAFAAS